ncbi:MAG TPA: amidohydrolase family protein [Candidatus Dormibacteraeota bacterium]|nr:amidohydrolase family protein [Candidatus Dormibacteraeota bacterium]
MKVVRAERLIDGAGGTLEGGVDVVLEGTTITDMGQTGRVKVPDGAEIIDAGGATLIPGLMDGHLHLSFFNAMTFKNHRAAAFEVTPQLQQLYALLHAQISMEMGFTTLRDVGGYSYAGHFTPEMVAIREAVKLGITAGPRLLVAGWAMITNSHLDCLMPSNLPRLPGVTADGPWELRRLVRSQLRTGADLIKTCVSGGAGDDKEGPTVRNMTQEELDAIVDEAHAFGKRCATHCFTPAAQKMALRAGADTLEHSVFTDDEAIDMMKARGIILFPTLNHRTDHAIELRREMGTAEFVLHKMKTLQPHTMDTFKRLYRAGVKLALGTDTACDPEMGTQAAELEIYVNLGMTTMDAIKAGTKHAAEALGIDDVVGTLAPGKIADMVAVDGNPLDDITVLKDKKKILVVMRDGRIFVDRRPGQRERLIHDESWGWKIAI